MIGAEALRREFQVLHSTSWSVTEAKSNLDNHSPQIVTTHQGLAAKIENNLQSKLGVYASTVFNSLSPFSQPLYPVYTLLSIPFKLINKGEVGE